MIHIHGNKMIAIEVMLQQQQQQQQDNTPSPILIAAKNGDAEELEKLLNQKSENYDRRLYPEYPKDWKYQYRDLLKADEEGRTSLQLACSVGNHDMALQCVQILFECLQVAAPDHEDDYRDKSYEFINYTLHGKQSALHLAIENKATQVISYLLDRNANLAAKSLKGIDALTLICQQVPDALREVYDNAIQLTKDHKGFLIDWGPLVGVRRQVQVVVTATEADRTGTDNNEEGTGNYRKIPGEESDSVDGQDRKKKVEGPHSTSNSSYNNTLVVSLWKETEYLSYILKTDKWGTNLLLHPLVKLFLGMKWNRIHWFFWVPFILEILWLLMYAVAFVQLHLYVEALNNASVLEPRAWTRNNEDTLDRDLGNVYIVWSTLFFVTVLAAGKELYSACILKGAYCTFENLAQISFILLYALQFALLMAGDPEHVATISTVGIALSTTLMIFQLGKTPLFGQQVAAMKKVIYSCAPHMPLFFVWFLGFCLIFWALFYKSNESSVVVLLAIVAAMGTGELNAKDHLEESLKRSLELQDLISVFCLLLFIITIVTLYFNLLIGYAVSDIQLLKQKAEAFEMSNRLSTVFTIESFLLSKFGRMFVRFKSGLESMLGKPSENEIWTREAKGDKKTPAPNAEALMTDVYMESIYVIPPSQFQKSATIPLSFDKIPPKILKQFKEIAYGNLMKEKDRRARFLHQLEKLQKRGE